MVNTPQSSRLNTTTNARLFGNATTGQPSYYATKFYNRSGETNVQIKEKTPANPIHYLVGAGVIIAIVMYASHKMNW